MNKRIVYDNGGIHVIIPCPQAQLTGESEDDFVNRVAKKDVPYGVPYKIINTSDIPADRSFREAWEEKNRKISVNINKARTIHMNRLREMRKPIFEKLDVEAVRAMEDKDEEKLEEIKAKKQVLRDIPQTLDLSEVISPDVLKTIIPDALKE
jgi:hypothetical protein